MHGIATLRRWITNSARCDFEKPQLYLLYTYLGRYLLRPKAIVSLRLKKYRRCAELECRNSYFVAYTLADVSVNQTWTSGILVRKSRF